MSSKERPTLGGTRIKTRKRNIAAPLDPAAFSDAVVQIYLDNAGDLELIAKSIESSDLNFSRYGDTFFEVVFIGCRTQPGTTKPDEGERHPYSIIECEPKREFILPSVIYIQKILRRRPFLIKNLENVMRKFLQSLELFEENERKKLAIFTALAFSQKLSGLPPETVFQPLLKDNLVAKGLVLSFMTDFFKEYLIDNSLDDLISILKRGKVEDNLLDIFPPAKRSNESFSEHFSKEGLVALVEYNEKKIFEVKLKEMKSALTTQITEEADISEVIETVKLQVRDAKLPDIEVVRVLWDVLMDAVQWSGKNQQQNSNAALRQVKTWSELLNTFCTTGKLELELLYKVQMQCYEDARLVKLFPEIVRSLYEADVLAEDTILHWFRKGTNTKGRQNFTKALEPFAFFFFFSLAHFHKHITPMAEDGTVTLYNTTHITDPKQNPFSFKVGLSQTLRGGTIFQVSNLHQAKIAEEAGARAIVVSDPVTRHEGISRMPDPLLVKEIKRVVSVPVVARARVGHFVEAQILEAIGVDYVDESEELGVADHRNFINKHNFRTPFVCGSRNLGEALRRIREGAAMIRTQGDLKGSGNIVESVKNVRSVMRDIRVLSSMDEDEVFAFSKKIEAPYDLVVQTKQLGRLPVVNFAAGGIVTPADAALMMQLGCDGVFLGSEVFDSPNPFNRVRGIVQAVRHYNDPHVLAETSSGFGLDEEMEGLNLSDNRIESFDGA